MEKSKPFIVPLDQHLVVETTKSMRARRANPSAGMLRFRASTRFGNDGGIVSEPSHDTASQVAYTWLVLEDEINDINANGPSKDQILTFCPGIASLQPSQDELAALTRPGAKDADKWIQAVLLRRMEHHPKCTPETLKTYGRLRRSIRDFRAEKTNPK